MATKGAEDSGNGAARIASPLSTLAMDDEALVAAWCDRYSVTRAQLVAATTMVGLMPAALHFYLTSRGRPTKVVTDEMRASRAPIRPRDRRRRDVAEIVVPQAPSQETALETLRQECSRSALDVRAAADGLHAHPCPSTIRAYDQAQEQFEATAARLDAAQRAADALAALPNAA